MKKEYKSVIPLLCENIKIMPFNKHEFLIEHEVLNYQVNVNANVINIIKLIDGERNISEIVAIFNNLNKDKLTDEIVYDILYLQLSKFGFIEQDDFDVKKREKAKYLKLSFELISPKISNLIASYLVCFFNPFLFYSLIVILPAFFISIVYLFHVEIVSGIESVFSPKIIMFFFLFGLWTFIHEFGHVTACKKFGVSPGGIGFGFYLFSPVLFSDVSKAWQLRRKERIIVNIAGIYFEFIGAAISIIVFLITRIELFLILPCFMIIDTLYNFNPLVKYDGYWILSDLLDIPNLHKKSQDLLYNTIKKRKFYLLNSFKEYFLIFYAIISLCFIMAFVILVLIFDSNSLLYFPKDVALLFSSERSFELNISNIGNYLVPLIFYVLLFKYIANIYLRLKKHYITSTHKLIG